MIEEKRSFCVKAPDDSMSPVIRRDMLVEFDPALEPRHEDIVLVKDGGGEWHIRTYLKGPMGRWEARAEGDRGLSLDSERDKLEVLAVYVAAHGRRG